MTASHESPRTGQILIVDDVPTNLELLSRMLRDRGHHVRTSRDGPHALRAVHSRPPDLILLDVFMPDIGGYEVIRDLAGKKETRNIPIIVITAKDFDRSTLDMFKAESNVVAFLTKPFRPKSLRATIRTILAKE